MNTFTTRDGTTIYYKDRGSGPVVTFSHGWPLSADAWDAQILFLRSEDIAWLPMTGVAMDVRARVGKATTWINTPTISPSL